MSISRLSHARRAVVPVGLIASFVLGGSIVGSVMAAGDQTKPGAVLPGPSYVAGARVLSLGVPDAQVVSGTAGATLVSDYTPIASVYSTAGGVVVPVNLPPGATIVQIDVYAYHVVSGSMSWFLTDWNPVNGLETDVLSKTFTGTGMVHGVISPTLAQGTHAATNCWAIWANAIANFRFVGAIIQYKLATLSLEPVTPFRVLDTRITALGPIISAGSPRTVSLKNAIDSTGAVIGVGVPAGAVAVAYNLTVTGTVGSGWVALVPGAGTTVSTSAINWSAAGTTVANGGIVTLGTGSAEREITIVVGGSHSPKAHVILDITGVFVSEAG